MQRIEKLAHLLVRRAVVMPVGKVGVTVAPLRHDLPLAVDDKLRRNKHTQVIRLIVLNLNPVLETDKVELCGNAVVVNLFIGCSVV